MEEIKEEEQAPKEKVQEDITSFQEIKEKHPDVSDDNLFRLVLVCKNCGHKDLLINFLQKLGDDKDWDRIRTPRPYPVPSRPYPNPYNPPKPNNPYNPKKPLNWPNKRYISYKKGNQNQTTQSIYMSVVDSKYKEFFFCPKCGSSLVALSSEYAKNNIVRML